MNIQPLSSNTLTGVVTQQAKNVASGVSASKPAQNQQTVNASVAQGNPISRDQLNSAIKATQDFVGIVNSSLEFTVDEDTGTTVVKIVDKETNELIRQIPSEEMLSIAKALDTIKGLLVRQKA